MFGITAANLFLCLNGAIIHQNPPDGVHHDLSVLETWGCDHPLVSWEALVTLYADSLT